MGSEMCIRDRVIGAAVAAAASALKSPPVQAPPPTPSLSSAPRRLNDRKVPDFWEDRPEFWFRIFDAHLAHFKPTERQCFDALLPLLTPAARAHLHSAIRNPGPQPYSKARLSLMRHFGKTPRQLARELRDARSIGEKLPTEFLDHVRGLVPDWNVFLEVVLLDALPANARDAALQQQGVDSMAEAADLVVLENRVAAASLHDTAVNSVSVLQDPDELSAPSPSVAAVSRDPKPHRRRFNSLCVIHSRFGDKAYKCANPKFCKMRGVLQQRPSPSAAPGNAPAGGRQ